MRLAPLQSSAQPAPGWLPESKHLPGPLGVWIVPSWGEGRCAPRGRFLVSLSQSCDRWGWHSMFLYQRQQSCKSGVSGCDPQALLGARGPWQEQEV